MTINLHLPTRNETLRPTITVVGVGGAGGNAVNNMIAANLEGVSFVVANTDAQALENSLTERRIQLGANITRGLGAGASPEVGRAAAEEAMDEIAGYIQGSNMVFITAGMGGGTGTGAGPVVARLAREQGILTVGVVTRPFQFEGTYRMKLADAGIAELQNYVDTLIVIPNQNLFRIANEHTTFADAFKMADEVLHSGVRGVTDLMVMPGLINLDFADIRTVMREMGKAMMGTGEAEGARRAVEAAEAAISNPLLDDVSMKGARGVLINITGGPDMTLFEVDEAANRIREEVDPEANIIFGSTFNDGMEGKMRVSVVATGIDLQANVSPAPRNPAVTEKKPFSYGSAVRSEIPKASKPVIELPKEVMRSAQESRPFDIKPMITAPAQRAPEPQQPQSYEQPKAAPEPRQAEPAQHAPEQRVQAEAPRIYEQKDFTFPAAAQAPAPVDQDASFQYEDHPQQRASDPAQSHQPEPGQRAFVESGLRTTLGVASYPPATQAQRPAEPLFGRAPEQQQAESVAQAPVLQQQHEPRDVRAAAPVISPRQESVRELHQPQHQAQPQQQAYREPEPAEPARSSGGGSLSFFQKVAGIGRTLAASRGDEYETRGNVAVAEKPKVEVSPLAQQSPEEEYLDIPAFLRRQAN